MARINVWVPDELAARARARGLNVSALTQSALRVELDRHATDEWLDGLLARSDADAATTPSHDEALAALHTARDEFDGGSPR